MPVTIQQAVFGPLKGHAFLNGSDSSFEPVFRDAAWRTDLPQTVPAGVVWTPFFRLVPHKDWLMLIHTRPAELAARGGMVLSRAAFIPLSIVEALDDLRPLSDLLQTTWSNDENLQPIVFDETRAREHQYALSPLTTRIAAALCHTTQRPIVVTAQEGFDEAMLDMWNRVPPEFRKSLTFGLSFGPDDVHELSVVCTPSSLAARWAPSAQVDFLQLETNGSYTASLLDLPQEDSVRTFAKIAELSLDSATAITIALQAADLWKNGGKPSDHIQLLRILARAGDSVGAASIKAQVVERLIQSAEIWNEQDILYMRNIDLDALPKASNIANCLNGWASQQSLQDASQGLTDILASWSAEKATPMWLSSIGEGLEANFAVNNADNPFKLLWHVLAKLPGSCSRTMSLVADTSLIEKRMLSSMDRTIAEGLADLLQPSAAARNWWTFAGTLLARSREGARALKEALELNPKNNAAKFRLVAGALSETSDAQTVNIAVKSGDAIALQVGAEACLRTSASLLDFDWRDVAWFRLLNHAFEKSAEIVHALPNVQIGISQVISSRLTDKMVWRVISMSSLADLVDVPGRSEAWKLIPQDYIKLVKAATATSWLLRFENGLDSAADLEPELIEAVHKTVHARGYLLEVLRRSSSQFPRFLREFPFQSDLDCSRFLEDVLRNDLRLSEAVASKLGRHVLENNWVVTANAAKNAVRLRNDFQPVLKECLKLFGFVDQLWLGYQLNMPLLLSADEAWQAFEAEAISMYPSGPSERGLWSRSGGKDEDLVHEQTGKATWHRCVRDLRKGLAPGIQPLLEMMLEDFTYSDTLRMLLRQKF